MTPVTQSAPVRHWNADAGATTPSLDRKAGTVLKIMPHLPAFWRQRHATRTDTARRLARVEVEVEALGAQVTLDSIVLGTTKAHLTPEPGVITAATRRSDEATCAALAELIWTPAERLAFHAMRADADGGA